MTTDFDTIRAQLEAIDQAHVLTFYDDLDEGGRRELLGQLGALPLDRVAGWVEKHVVGAGDPAPDASRAEPVASYPADPEAPHRPWDAGAIRARGAEIIGAGKVAAFTVAGGQGTRLGFDGPKGAYPATPILRKPLFRVLAEQILASESRFGTSVPWYIMTSPLNHAATQQLFAESGFFGFDPRNVRFFSQGVLPSFTPEGKLILATRSRIATNPDGHGGSLLALHNSGALADMRRRGIEHISYVQIDNPLAKVIDPEFVGLHAAAEDSSGEMSSKMVAKAEPGERVGVFAKLDGRVHVIEYSDMSEEQAGEREGDGRLRFNAGNIASHMLGVGFVEGLTAGGDFALPFHRAKKKVPYVDLSTGEPVEPDEPNAIKLETFVFDALPRCSSSVVLEVERVEEFAPIKNAEGKDSPATSKALQVERGARWLEAAGCAVPRDDAGSPACTIEISPLEALGPDDLGDQSGRTIRRGEQVLICYRPDRC